jgi:hypothetical protein
MSAHDNGGPAFPITAEQHPNGISPDMGMTLRDYFAAKAMQGFLGGHVAHYGHENHWRFQDMAGEAYAVADAMLKARQA